MDRTIRVRSTLTDRKEEELERLGREKEAELRAGGVTATHLFTSVCIAPDLEKGRLGYFSPHGRLIVISENLAWGDDGSALRGVFLHELALPQRKTLIVFQLFAQILKHIVGEQNTD